MPELRPIQPFPYRIRCCTPERFYRGLRSKLTLTAKVISKTGPNINDGEMFTVRFTVHNNSAMGNYAGVPEIVFKNVTLRVEGTSFAELQSSQNSYSLPHMPLWFNESTYVDLEFKAVGHWMRPLEVMMGEELIAKTWLEADLDLDRFFKVRSDGHFYEDIIES